MSEAEHHSPLAQFEVTPLIPFKIGATDLSFTNASLWMIIAATAIIAFMLAGVRKRQLVPGRWQSSSEVLIEFIQGLIRDNCGKEGLKYFPIIFSLFMFILFCNVFGMLPGSFTVTSHLIVTFALAGAVFVGVTLLAIIKHGPIKFIKFFLPHGTPWWMAPLMYVIEVISYLSRPISLSVRLAANMMVGHMILKIAAGFIVMMGILGGWLPFGFVLIFTGFEIFIAVLQAYIFTVLTCVYLNDALHLH
ncbi:MAG: F0F1 ATP synthase subunit A [Rickettsiales bacterium]|nr:F0F1 ATP synthase subunit A [Rickettsiales bacterium]